MSQIGGGSGVGADLYNGLEFIKKTIPAGQKLFMFATTDLRYVILNYHLIENYQIVKAPAEADYLLVYDMSPSIPAEFALLASFGPERLILKRK